MSDTKEKQSPGPAEIYSGLIKEQSPIAQKAKNLAFKQLVEQAERNAEAMDPKEDNHRKQ